MLRSFTHLLAVDPGFRSDNVLTFRISLPYPSYPGRDDMASFHHRFLDRLQALPGVEVAGAVNALPLTGLSGLDPLVVEGQPQSADAVPPSSTPASSRPATSER